MDVRQVGVRSDCFYELCYQIERRRRKRGHLQLTSSTASSTSSLGSKKNKASLKTHGPTVPREKYAGEKIRAFKTLNSDFKFKFKFTFKVELNSRIELPRPLCKREKSLYRIFENTPSTIPSACVCVLSDPRINGRARKYAVQIIAP